MVGIKRDETSNGFLRMSIPNPKRHMDPLSIKESRLFSYYAGYSTSFTAELLRSLQLEPGAVILDPWNGSGTTTNVASQFGYTSIGFDLNPVMVIVAKAAVLSPREALSLPHLARSLVEQSLFRIPYDVSKDPLSLWLFPKSAEFIRRIELKINHTLISFNRYEPLKTNVSLDKVSSLAAFLYLALFRTTRRLLSDFIPSNPTWTKRPAQLRNRKKPSCVVVIQAFLEEVELLSTKIFATGRNVNVEQGIVSLKLGNAENMLLPNRSVDAVISSPPYCTRIDYAVATAIELAVLGFSQAEFDSLRRVLTGTSTVPAILEGTEELWGPTCLNFLESVYSHSSKASRTYYFKNHIQYFRSLSRSIAGLSRVLSKNGRCVLVVQDSRYKELHNDVPTMVCEMAALRGMKLIRREDFHSSRSMAQLNAKSRKYLSPRMTTESVLVFTMA